MIVPMPGRPSANRDPTGPGAPRDDPLDAVPRANESALRTRLAATATTRSPRLATPPLSVGSQPGGLDSATWQRFRSGKLPAARTLDLHGMTVQHAYHALVSFLRSAHADRVRCVEVVTGRGSGQAGGSIRREFPLWLNLPDIRPLVLGAAHPHALNPGSVRLLLRRVR